MLDAAAGMAARMTADMAAPAAPLAGAALNDMLIAEVSAYSKDPLGFVLYAFPWGEGALADFDGPDAWQRDTLDAIARGLLTPDEAIQIAVASGHGIGKSALVAWLILWSMSTFEDTRGVVTANTENQLRTKTWAEVGKWHRLLICRDWFELTATALHARQPGHDKTWRIDMVPWSEHNDEAFAGLHNQGKRVILIFDEASAIADKIWETAEGALTDADTQIVWCAFGNPTRNTGRFRECFRRFRHRWTTRHIDSRDVKVTNKKQIQKRIDDHGIDSDVVKVRVLGQFPSASARQFIGQDLVDAAFGRHLRPEQYAFAPVIIGVDPAWTGEDAFVIVMRQGLYAKVLATYDKNDDDGYMANVIARFEDELGAAAVYVDGGFGTGIVSAGKALRRSWRLVWFSGKATDPQFLNKRVEMWDGVKRWLKSGGALPPDDTLRDDLTAPELIIRAADGKHMLEPKEDMKARGLPSPNHADALALTFADEIATAAGGAGKPRVAQDFDPYEET